MGLSDEDVREILRMIDESPLEELRIEMEGLKLYVAKAGAAGASPATGPLSTNEVAEAPASPTSPDTGHQAADGAQQSAAGEGQQAEEAAPSREPARSGEAAQRDGRLTIESPMLGTFYRAEGPGQDPFVDVGSRVEPDTIVCIIEVMKMMNSVPAGVAGTIAEVCAQNGKLVEYGQPLFRVEPE